MADASNNDEWIAEQTIADRLNVSRDTLRARRPYLRAGEVRQNGQQVEWQKNAAQRIASELGLPWATAPEDGEKTACAATPAPATATDVETLMVINTALNPHIVNARRANGERVAVRVVDNTKYVPIGLDGKPMTLQARRSPAGAWWTLAGREPRWRGRF